MRNIVILGSTGTIGQNTLEVVRRNRKRFTIIGIACQTNTEVIASQIEEFAPRYVYIEERDIFFEHKFPGTTFLYGEEGLDEIATLKEADIIICAVPGIKTLKPIISAIKKKKTIGLATKEVLVVAGDIITSLSKKYGVKILPIDSEHNALFQALRGVKKNEISKVYITASGGPFYGIEKKGEASLDEVLAHPVWKMGKKITVDSATMMNKAFEIIEAHYLFNLPSERIDVLIHPEAIVHGMVELVDGTIKGIFSFPDMKIPISFVLNYPHRNNYCWQHIDFSKAGLLHFYPVDRKEIWFSLAREAIEKKGSFPVVLNGANEEAVSLFLKGCIRFEDIISLVKKIVDNHKYRKDISVEEIILLDRWAKDKAKEIAGDKK
ncbi:MAG: 1-deoxy-D-xylulose-5-phosphate reductoisomerase [Candidatus Omnitrophica bacterium]|nr:1-deoxy-D-xylulose-5-phosphate reductoisomerase [Candidatus Omnitrophota bacterium]MCM8777680.1 1-deoxy-D-xylulose-5-phosphate reductoisomerase [Candidatus Omnitrophota bacterium]